jgi:hypothetical protein
MSEIGTARSPNFGQLTEGKFLYKRRSRDSAGIASC